MNYEQLLQKNYDEGKCFVIQVFVEAPNPKNNKWKFADPEDFMTLPQAESHLWSYKEDHDVRIVKVARYIPFGWEQPVIHQIVKFAKKGKPHDY